jgi:geranylgeranylglycerol-phosphate geranylgeranyltransferase
MKNRIYKKAKALMISIRPKTTPLGIISVYVGGLVAGGAYDSIDLLLAVIVTFFITGSSMTFNDYYDWQIDKINHPDRPIPKGIISPKEILYFSIIFFIIGTIISLFINLICFGIVIISIVLLVLYENFSKNVGIFSNLTVGFISSIAFTFGGAAVGNPYPTLVLSIMTFFVMTGREIIMDIRDADGDRLIRKTLPNQIGKKPATYIANIFLLLTVLMIPIPYIMQILNEWYLVIIIPVGIITLLAVFYSLRDVNNAGKSASLIRISAALALIAFIIGIIT